jgi:hypothetical protein
MKDNPWNDWIHRRLKTDSIEPACDDFYAGVWEKIHKQESALLGQGKPSLSYALGAACWKAAPIFAGSVLGILIYGWFYPPEMNGQLTSSVDAYVWDAGAVPSHGSLIYQILNSEPGVEAEAKP